MRLTAVPVKCKLIVLTLSSILNAFENQESSFEAQVSRCLKNFQENNFCHEYVTIEINNTWLRVASLSRASVHVSHVNIQIVSLELKSSIAII